MHEQQYDVLVIGGGNAGLCAALTARQAGASVLVLDSAPRHFRGGNSRHTRNFRCAHAGADRCPDRVVPRGRVSRRSQPRDRPRGRPGALAAAGVEIGRMSGVDASVRRPVPVVAPRHAASWTDERVLPGRRQGADEQLLRRGRARRHSRRVRRRGRRTRRADGRFTAATVRRTAARKGSARDRTESPLGRSSSPPAGSSRTSSGCARRGGARPTTSSFAARRTTPARSSG